ncbi:MAG: hypothetical protein JW882_07900 [Deltaproteobacteria bacterium]|nr:hypothetical protein [Deltaproteobacteria bacterium]
MVAPSSVGFDEKFKETEREYFDNYNALCPGICFNYCLDRNPNKSYPGIMKTTIGIPENGLMQAMEYTGAKTKKAEVVFALKGSNTKINANNVGL